MMVPLFWVVGEELGWLQETIWEISGQLLVSRYDQVLDLMSVEMLLCQDASLFARNRDLQHFLLETDCLKVKGLWKSSSEKSTDYHILCQMKEIVHSFHGFKLLFCSVSGK